MDWMRIIPLISLGFTIASVVLFIANIMGWIDVGFLPLLLLFVPLVLPFGRRKREEESFGEVDHCPECGNMVFPDEEFCAHCGRMLIKD